jgi:hypothetical protein
MLKFKYIAVLIFIAFTAVSVCEGQSKGQTKGRSPEKALFGKSRKVKVKETKVREPRAVTKAKRKQEKKEEKNDKEYQDYLSDSRKRSFKIQTPDVQERMKNNARDIKARDKSRKKQVSSSTKSGARKYKR